MGLSLKRITGSQGLNLGKTVGDVLSSPVGAIAAGALLGPAGLGLATSGLGAAAMVGGLNALATGNIGAGLQAGLGAYGGYGLGQSLSSLGTGALSQAAGAGLSEEAAQQAVAQKLAESSALDTLQAGASRLTEPGGISALTDTLKGAGYSPLMLGGALAAPFLLQAATAPKTPMPDINQLVDKGSLRPYRYDPYRQYYTPEMPVKLAGGGIADLGDYSDGGRLLKGPGDGVSDSIPAVIGGKQPARLAAGEFVIPSRIVSELGNGSTEAGARKLYEMMDRVQKARSKTIGEGRGKLAKNTRAEKYLPA